MLMDKAFHTQDKQLKNIYLTPHQKRSTAKNYFSKSSSFISEEEMSTCQL